jgi:hypothetical protein
MTLARRFENRCGWVPRYTGINGKCLDQYAAQDCIRHMAANDWLVGDRIYGCQGIVHFDTYSVSLPTGWSSPPTDY